MCFHTLFRQSKISPASQKQTRKNREEKILPSCPMSLHNKVLKGNLSVFLPVRASHSPGERRAVSKLCGLIVHAALSVQNIKGAGKGCWRQLLRGAQRQRSVKEEQPALASEAERAGTPLTVPSLPLLSREGREGFLSAAQRGRRGLHLPSVACILGLGQGVRACLLMAKRD